MGASDEVALRAEHRRWLERATARGGFLSDSDGGQDGGLDAVIPAGDNDTTFIRTANGSRVADHFFPPDD